MPEPSSYFRSFEISDGRYLGEGIRHVTVKSPALGRRADLSLKLVGKDWGAKRDSLLVILLHGVYGSHWSWLYQGGVGKVADRLHKSGDVPSMTLAMPSDGLWGDGSGYVAHPQADYEKWIMEEVPRAAAWDEDGQRSFSSICIGGLSMGGFGALRLAGKYGNRILAASGHSAITHFWQLEDFVEEPLDSYAVKPEDQSVAETLIRNKASLPAIRFDCGINDSLLKANRDLSATLREAGIDHEYEESDGGHDWDYWHAQVEITLRFFAKHYNSVSKTQ